jgi:hypothetical protein
VTKRYNSSKNVGNSTLLCMAVKGRGRKANIVLVSRILCVCVLRFSWCKGSKRMQITLMSLLLFMYYCLIDGETKNEIKLILDLGGKESAYLTLRDDGQGKFTEIRFPPRSRLRGVVSLDSTLEESM